MVDATFASRNFNYYAWDPEFFENNTVVEYIWLDGTFIAFIVFKKSFQ